MICVPAARPIRRFARNVLHALDSRFRGNDDVDPGAPFRESDDVGPGARFRGNDDVGPSARLLRERRRLPDPGDSQLPDSTAYV